MPLGYEETSLWKDSLGVASDAPYAKERERLRSAYHAFRQRAAMVAAEIPQDLREFTVHDVTHLDALWEMADLICGRDNFLTPTEAYVLGGAFLIHDLGMGLAAWPGGMDSLTTTPQWNDILAGCVSSELGRPASKADVAQPSDKAINAAKGIALRELHASRASELASTSWSSSTSSSAYYLIDDADLRNAYGRLIGRLAESHWWDLDRVVEEFSSVPIGAPVDCPDEWIVDSLKLACLIRLADAAHLDSRRAPGFLRALRKPGVHSDPHWIFQERLQRPRVEGDRLVFTSPRPFEIQEAAAWWLCFETLQMVDKELHGVDSLLSDMNRPRMKARSVRGADSPFRLSEFIPTSGWTPVDARVTVRNVPQLVRKLGGEELYGVNPEVALRELIQNARDATEALKSLGHVSVSPIKVVLRQDSDGWWLDVADFGIGMSQQVLTGPLLDFGSSYWGSELMRAESVGLAASGFQSVGRFGIGFYAVFMLGDTVRVVSRRFDAAWTETQVLEFESGLEHRPILRPAIASERRYVGGTTVSVRLRKDPYSLGGLLALDENRRASLNRLCAWLAPALTCDLNTLEGDGSEEVCVRADDWKSMPADALLARLVSLDTRDIWSHAPVELGHVARAVTTIEHEGEIIARGALSSVPPVVRGPDGDFMRLEGLVVAGGLHMSALGGVVGIFTGSPTTAVRSSGVLLGPRKIYSDWATGQAQYWASTINRHQGEWPIYASFLCLLGAYTHGVHICVSNAGYMDYESVKEWAKRHRSIVCLESYPIDVLEDVDGLTFWDRSNHRQLILSDNVVVVRDSGQYGDWKPWERLIDQPSWLDTGNLEDIGRRRGINSPEGYVLRAVREGWGLPQDRSVAASSSVDMGQSSSVGKYQDGRTVTIRSRWTVRR